MSDDSLVGKSLGPFRIVRLLGEGGMGRVYEGHDDKNDRRIAIKTLSRQGLSRPEHLSRFKREVTASARISHPNVVTIYDGDVEHIPPYLVMEYLEGETLEHLIIREKYLRLQPAVSLVLAILDGLGDLHGAGLIHRDLKHSNIFVTLHGIPKIMDLGLVKDHRSDGLTRVGGVLGTPRYLPPEALLAREIVPASDLYQVAVILFECLTGHSPFGGRTTVDKLRRILRGRVRPLSRYMRGHSPEFEKVLLKALSHEPKDRFADAASFASALRDGARAMGVDVDQRTLEGVEIENKTASPDPVRRVDTKEQDARLGELLQVVAELKDRKDEDGKPRRKIRIRRRYKKETLVRAALLSLTTGLAIGAASVIWFTMRRAPEAPATSASPSLTGPRPLAIVSEPRTREDLARHLERLRGELAAIPPAVRPRADGVLPGEIHRLEVVDPAVTGSPSTMVSAIHRLGRLARLAYRLDPAGPWVDPGLAHGLCDALIRIAERLPPRWRTIKVSRDRTTGGSYSGQTAIELVQDLVLELGEGGRGTRAYWSFYARFLDLCDRPRLEGITLRRAQFTAMALWQPAGGPPPLRQAGFEEFPVFWSPPPLAPELPVIPAPEIPGREIFHLDHALFVTQHPTWAESRETIRDRVALAWSHRLRQTLDFPDRAAPAEIEASARLIAGWPPPGQPVATPKPWARVYDPKVFFESLQFDGSTEPTGPVQPRIGDWVKTMNTASVRGFRLEFVGENGAGLLGILEQAIRDRTPASKKDLEAIRATLEYLALKSAPALEEKTSMEVDLEPEDEEVPEATEFRDRRDPDSGLWMALALVTRSLGRADAAASCAVRALGCWFRRASGPPVVDPAWRPRVLALLARLHGEMSTHPETMPVLQATMIRSAGAGQWTGEQQILVSHFYAQWGLMLLGQQVDLAAKDQELLTELETLARETRRLLEDRGIVPRAR